MPDPYNYNVISGVDNSSIPREIKVNSRGELISSPNPFKTSANLTRPANTTQYAVKDAITDSTSAPTVLSFDFSSFDAVVNGFYRIYNARVISSIAQSTLPLINIILFNTSFTATNDNSALSIDDTTAQSGGIVIPCYNTYDLGANSRCVSDPGAIWQGQFSSSNTTIYGTLQAANAYTPGSGERFDVILEGELL